MKKDITDVPYYFKNENNFIACPLATSLSLGIRFGMPGFIGGGLIGIFDEVLVQYKITDSYYLSSAALAASTFSMIQSQYNILTITGFIIGFTTPMGIYTTEHVEKLLLTTALGSSLGKNGVYAGLTYSIGSITLENYFDIKLSNPSQAIFDYTLYCAALPKIVGLINYPLSRYQITEPVSSKINSFFQISYSYQIVSALITSLSFKYSEKSTQLWAPLSVGKQLYNTFSKLIPSDDLNHIISRQVFTSFAVESVIQCTTLKLINFQQSITKNYHSMYGASKNENWNKFSEGMIQFSLYIPIYFITQYIKNIISILSRNNISFLTTNILYEKLFSKEVLLKLSREEESNVLVDKLGHDMNVLFRDAPLLIDDAITSIITSTMSIGNVIKLNGHDLLCTIILYERFIGYFIQYFTEQTRKYNDAIRSQEILLIDIQKDTINNIQAISLKNGINFNQVKIEQVYSNLNYIKLEKSLWQDLTKTFKSIDAYLSFCIQFLIVAHKLYTNKIMFTEREQLLYMISESQNMFKWPNRKSGEIEDVQNALNKISLIINKITTEETKQLSAKILHSHDNQSSMMFIDFSIGIETRTLLSLNSLKLTKGIYALTGPSGCGKSSFISKVVGIENDHVWSQGTIIFSSRFNIFPEVVVATQKTYCPINSTLLEVISYPKVLPVDYTDIENKVKFLIKKFFSEKSNNLPLEKLDKIEKCWCDLLSGGQQKKISLISTIIQDPEFLILDEIFAGMDNESIIQAEKIIREELPDSLILVVDHHVTANNYCLNNGLGFYDSEIRIHNRTIDTYSLSCQPIPGQTIDDDITNDL